MKNLLTLSAIFAASLSIQAKSPITDSAQFYFNKGIEEKAAKRYLVAATMFEKSISFNKTNAEVYFQNAVVNEEMRKTDLAKLNYTKAYELQPSNVFTIKALTNLYYNYRQWDKAIEFANKCNSCDNADRIIGMSHYKKEDYALAEKFLMKAIAKNPADAEANYTLGRNYMDADLNRKAVPYFEKAVQLSPDKYNWAYELGLVYFDLNNFKGAVASFETALKSGYTANNDFNENYGYALLYSGDIQRGEEKIVEIFKKKGNIEMLRELATILYNQKQYDRSLDYCSKLLEANPKDGKALYQAGLAFIKLGKKDKGQGMCDKAIELDPSLASKKSSIGDMSGGL
jgi:tetratricopeptide (TPR) repeat protein